MEEAVSERGENRTQGRGRKRRTRRGGKRPWREKMSEVERTGRKEGEGSGARRRGTRGPGGVYPGKPGPKGPGDTRTLRSMQGWKLPHVRKPLLLPPVISPQDFVAEVAERFASAASIPKMLEFLQSRGPIMSSALTHLVNCSSVSRPSSRALSLRVISFE